MPHAIPITTILHDDDTSSDIVKVSPPLSLSSTMDEKPKVEIDEKKVRKEDVDVQGIVDETVRRVREQSDR